MANEKYLGIWETQTDAGSFLKGHNNLQKGVFKDNKGEVDFSECTRLHSFVHSLFIPTDEVGRPTGALKNSPAMLTCELNRGFMDYYYKMFIEQTPIMAKVFFTRTSFTDDQTEKDVHNYCTYWLVNARFNSMDFRSMSAGDIPELVDVSISFQHMWIWHHDAGNKVFDYDFSDPQRAKKSVHG